MGITRTVEPFRTDASGHSVALVVVLTAAITACEALLYFGRVWTTVVGYTLLLFVLSLTPLAVDGETTILQAFALIPVFRLVNLTMPVFFEMTLLWLPFVYGPLVPVIVYLGYRAAAVDSASSPTDDPHGAPGSQGRGERTWSSLDVGTELPWWLGGDRTSKPRRLFGRVWRAFGAPGDASHLRSALHAVGRVLIAVAFALLLVAFLVSLGVGTVYIAEYEYELITPLPLIPSLTLYDVVVLTVVMVGFVGFVEELLFRGVLQKVLERRLGFVPGLLLASGVFGLMHSGHGSLEVIALAGGVGLLFGIVYDLTDSLVLVSVLHGSLNVLLFGVIPLDGGSSIDLLWSIVVRELWRVGIRVPVETLSLLDLWVFAGSL